jgi:hypothetical protein
VSLVGDALRKARQEATLRDARQLGAYPVPPLARPIRRSRLGLGLVVGLLAGAAVAIASGAAVWWVVGRSSTPTQVTAQPAESASPTLPGALPDHAASPDSATVATAPVAASRPQAEQGARVSVPTAAAPPARRSRAEQQRPSSPQAPEALQREAPVVPPPRPTPTQASRDWTGTREFVLDADVGGSHLSLGYIVFRETDPFAEINGEEVHVGSQVAGLTVVSIEADRVTLRGLHRTVVLRTR